MSWSKLEAKVRGDNEWTDIPTTHAQNDLNAKLNYLQGHGFKIKFTDHGFEVRNPLTKNIEVVYRLV